MSRPELVRHDAFYLKELNEAINLQRDYLEWHQLGMSGTNVLFRVFLFRRSNNVFLKTKLPRTKRKYCSVIMHSYLISKQKSVSDSMKIYLALNTSNFFRSSMNSITSISRAT